MGKVLKLKIFTVEDFWLSGSLLKTLQPPSDGLLSVLALDKDRYSTKLGYPLVSTILLATNLKGPR